LDFDEITLATDALRAEKPRECEGGVEGGESNSSDDDKESAHEEVSEMREGVRETVEECVLCPEGAGGIDSRPCDGVACNWDATLRGRGFLFRRSETTDFDPRMSDVSAVYRGCESDLYWIVVGGEAM
jgi:hypothetical protein